MKINEVQNESINEYQQLRCRLPVNGKDGFLWIDHNNIEIIDSELFLSTIESMIEIYNDSILDEIEVNKSRKLLLGMLDLHSKILKEV